MSLNAMMHPRNPFKDRKPNFKQLADKYEPFRQNITFDAKGKVILDFKNPSCLRALTWALLKDGFEIEVDMPLDRLIPTIPLRLNYLLWLEDIFPNQTSLRGIDIGEFWHKYDPTSYHITKMSADLLGRFNINIHE